MVDFLVIFILLMSALWGYLRGILRGVLSLASLLVAYWGSAPLGPSLGRAIAGRTGWSASMTYVLGRLAAGILIFASLRISTHVVDRKFGQTKQGVVHSWNRNWGAIGGLLSGALFVLIVLFVGDSLLKAFPEVRGGFIGSARGSFFLKQASKINPANRFLVTDCLKLLRMARRDPQVLENLREDQEVRALLEHPDVQSVLADEELAKAMRSYQMDKVFKNENLRRLLRNKELMKQMVSPQLRAAIREATREGGEVEAPEPAVPES